MPKKQWAFVSLLMKNSEVKKDEKPSSEHNNKIIDVKCQFRVNKCSKIKDNSTSRNEL